MAGATPTTRRTLDWLPLIIIEKTQVNDPEGNIIQGETKKRAAVGMSMRGRCGEGRTVWHKKKKCLILKNASLTNSILSIHLSFKECINIHYASLVYISLSVTNAQTLQWLYPTETGYFPNKFRVPQCFCKICQKTFLLCYLYRPMLPR